jgi:hypothetical protein
MEETKMQMTKKNIVGFGVPVAVIAGVYFGVITGTWATYLAGLVTAWAFFEYR